MCMKVNISTFVTSFVTTFDTKKTIKAKKISFKSSKS